MSNTILSYQNINYITKILNDTKNDILKFSFFKKNIIQNILKNYITNFENIIEKIYSKYFLNYVMEGFENNLKHL